MHALLFCEDLSDYYPSFVASEEMGITNAIARDFPAALFEGTRAKARLDKACAAGGRPPPRTVVACHLGLIMGGGSRLGHGGSFQPLG